MNERPSVCFVSDTVHSYFESGIETGTGGAERQQYLLANELVKRGFDVHVATLQYDSRDRQTVDDVTLWHIIPDVRGISNAPYKTLRLLRGLHRIDADIYYVRGNNFLCMVTALYTRTTGRQFVYAVANDSNVDPAQLTDLGVLRYLYVRAMQSADRVIAQTTHQKELLASEHDIDAVQIPNGYDLPPTADLAPHTDRQYVLWVGSMDPKQKRPKRFLDLARQLPDVQFRMIGPPDNDNPEYFDEVEADARSVPNLEFLGFVEPEDIHSQYRDAIGVVNTSDYEGFPNVFLEAWRYGTPVISLQHSLDGILTDEPVGIHAGSMDALVDAVERVTSNSSLHESLGLGGRTYMEENYSLEQLVDRYENILMSFSTS